MVMSDWTHLLSDHHAAVIIKLLQQHLSPQAKAEEGCHAFRWTQDFRSSQTMQDPLGLPQLLGGSLPVAVPGPRFPGKPGSKLSGVPKPSNEPRLIPDQAGQAREIAFSQLLSDHSDRDDFHL